MPFYLTLDQSTSASKALLFSETGKVVDRASIEHQQYYPKPGWVEHDAEEIWQNCIKVLTTLVERNTDRIPEIRCLSITNQRETVVVFDRATGNPLHRAMVWQCRRSVALCDQAIAEGYGEPVTRKTGLKIDAYFSASKLKWLMREDAGIALKLQNGEALIGTIETYLIYRLTLGRIFATDTTNASRTLLFDINSLRWDEELCTLWDVPKRALPEVRDSSSEFGETSLGGSLSRSLPICGVMGDSQAALFAQGCYEVGAAKVTFGTGSSILLNVGSEMVLPEKGLVTTLAWTVGGQATYAMEGIIISSAATLSWLKDQLGLFEDIDDVESIGRSLKDNGGVYLVPAFTGLGLPYWKAEARAAIVGLSSHSDRRHVIRAGLESIAYQVNDALAAMRESSGVALRGLNADGGPTANGFLMQLVADVCEQDLSVAGVAECSPLGAAIMGMLGLGAIESPEAFRLGSHAGVTYQPQLDSTTRGSMIVGWNMAVAQIIGSGVSSHAPAAF